MNCDRLRLYNFLHLQCCGYEYLNFCKGFSHPQRQNIFAILPWYFSAVAQLNCAIHVFKFFIERLRHDKIVLFYVTPAPVQITHRGFREGRFIENDADTFYPVSLNRSLGMDYSSLSKDHVTYLTILNNLNCFYLRLNFELLYQPAL